jgi:hypothetical protein
MPANHQLSIYFHILILGCYALTQDCTKIEVKSEEFWSLSCIRVRMELFRNEEKEVHDCWWDNE